jgi:hypothetical protein
MKLAARLRSYDWTAAFIELVIVVVGILIALQVSNWNQSRLDHARADNYYRRLHAELLADRHNIDSTLKFWNKVSDYGRAAIAYGETGQRVDASNWKTVLAYYQSSQLMPFELESSTYSEMRDSDGLGLIADEGLRKRLADYYRLTGPGITANILHHDPVYRMQVRGLTPWSVQQYIWDKCYRALGGANQELIDCPSPISEQEAAAVLDSYRQSESLLQNLRFWMSTLRVGVIVLDSTRKDTNSLETEIQATLAR